MYMPINYEEYCTIFVTRYYLSGQVEAQPLKTISPDNISEFLHEEIFCRHSVSRIIVGDRGLETKGIVESMTVKFDSYRSQIVPHYPESNGLVERGHTPIVDALSKATECAG